MFQTPAECPEETEDYCSEDSGCLEGMKCCKSGCEKDCVGKLRVKWWAFYCVFDQT